MPYVYGGRVAGRQVKQNQIKKYVFLDTTFN
jgi:hypothetical protein